MAEDIAAQFRHLPDDEAVAAVLNHVTMFWDPRMRARLVSLVASAPGPIDPVVVRVADALAVRGAPAQT